MWPWHWVAGIEGRRKSLEARQVRKGKEGNWLPTGALQAGRVLEGPGEERARGPAAKVGLRGVVGEGASSLSAAWEGPVLTGQQQSPGRWKGSQCFWSLSIGSEGLAGTGPPGPHRPSVTIFWSAR